MIEVRLRDEHGDILAAQHADDFGEASRQRRRDALEGFVQQQEARADRHARASATSFCWPPLSASALRWRIAATSGMRP